MLRVSIEQLYEETGTGYCRFRVELSGTPGTPEVVEIILNSNWQTGMRAIELGDYKLHIRWEPAVGMKGFDVQAQFRLDPVYKSMPMRLESVGDKKCVFIPDQGANSELGIATIQYIDKTPGEDADTAETLRSKAENAKQLSRQLREGASVTELLLWARVDWYNFPYEQRTSMVCVQDDNTSDELADILGHALEKMADCLNKRADAIESRYTAHE